MSIKLTHDCNVIETSRTSVFFAVTSTLLHKYTLHKTVIREYFGRHLHTNDNLQYYRHKHVTTYTYVDVDVATYIGVHVHALFTNTFLMAHCRDIFTSPSIGETFK